MVSLDSTSRVMVLPVRVLTKLYPAALVHVRGVCVHSVWRVVGRVRGHGEFGFKKTYICTENAEKKEMSAWAFTQSAGIACHGSLGHVLVASFRWCRRSVAVFEAEEAMLM